MAEAARGTEGEQMALRRLERATRAMERMGAGALAAGADSADSCHGCYPAATQPPQSWSCPQKLSCTTERWCRCGVPAAVAANLLGCRRVNSVLVTPRRRGALRAATQERDRRLAALAEREAALAELTPEQLLAGEVDDFNSRRLLELLPPQPADA